MSTQRNPFAKSRPLASPHAIYRAGPDFFWHVLKTYKRPDRERVDPFARWMVAAKSDATFGSFDMGDTYVRDVTGYGRLVACTPEWAEAYGQSRDLPTPEAYLAAPKVTA